MALSRKARVGMNEWMEWYRHNAEKISQQPLETQVKWLLKATHGAYECLSLVGRELNGEMRVNSTAQGIILPGSRW